MCAHKWDHWNSSRAPHQPKHWDSPAQHLFPQMPMALLCMKWASLWNLCHRMHWFLSRCNWHCTEQKTTAFPWKSDGWQTCNKCASRLPWHVPLCFASASVQMHCWSQLSPVAAAALIDRSLPGAPVSSCWESHHHLQVLPSNTSSNRCPPHGQPKNHMLLASWHLVQDVTVMCGAAKSQRHASALQLHHCSKWCQLEVIEMVCPQQIWLSRLHLPLFKHSLSDTFVKSPQPHWDLPSWDMHWQTCSHANAHAARNRWHFSEAPNELEAIVSCDCSCWLAD